MPNPITNNPLLLPGQDSIGNAPEASSPQPQQSSAPDTSITSGDAADSTDLTGLASVLSSSARTAASIPAVRTDVVERIRAQIDSGTYQPDPDAVAARVASALRGIQS